MNQNDVFTKHSDIVREQYNAKIKSILLHHFEGNLSSEILQFISKEEVNNEYFRKETLWLELISGCKSFMCGSETYLSKQLWENSWTYPFLFKLFFFLCFPIIFAIEIFAFMKEAVNIEWEDCREYSGCLICFWVKLFELLIFPIKIFVMTIAFIGVYTLIMLFGLFLPLSWNILLKASFFHVQDNPYLDCFDPPDNSV